LETLGARYIERRIYILEGLIEDIEAIGGRQVSYPTFRSINKIKMKISNLYFTAIYCSSDLQYVDSRHQNLEIYGY